MDNRGDATGIARFFLALLVGAVLYWIIEQVATPLLNYSSEAGSDPVAVRSTSYLQTFTDHWPVVVLFIALFSLLALGVFQRELLGT